METKRCPFCAEEIKIEAIKCKHCGSLLSDIKNNNWEIFFAKYEKYLALNFHGKYSVYNKDTENRIILLKMEYKSFSWVIFILLLLLWVLPGLIYALITLQKSTKNIGVKFNENWEVISSSMNTDSLMKKYNEQKI